MILKSVKTDAEKIEKGMKNLLCFMVLLAGSLTAFCQIVDQDFGQGGNLEFDGNSYQYVQVDEQENIYVLSKLIVRAKVDHLKLQKFNADGVLDENFGEQGAFNIFWKGLGNVGGNPSFQLYENHILIYYEAFPNWGLRCIDLERNINSKIEIENHDTSFKVLNLTADGKILYYQKPFVRAIDFFGEKHKSFAKNGKMILYPGPRKFSLVYSQNENERVKVVLRETGAENYKTGYLDVNFSEESIDFDNHSFEDGYLTQVLGQLYLYKIKNDSIVYERKLESIADEDDSIRFSYPCFPSQGYGENPVVKFENYILFTFSEVKDPANYNEDLVHTSDEYNSGLVLRDFAGNEMLEFGTNGKFQLNDNESIRNCLKLNENDFIVIIREGKSNAMYKVRIDSFTNE